MICRKCDEESVNIAADFLKRGKIVVLPTDTVYGFSGIVDGRHYSYHTDRKIREIKGRGDEKPFIQLISSPADLKKYTRDLVPDGILAKWPGALTVIVHTFVKGGITTTAFRCPGDEWLRAVIATCGAPIYSTSVNRSGAPVLDNVQDIKREFGNAVDVIVDDGSKRGNMPSTIVAVEADGAVRVVRQGAVTL
ncbi:MAG: L-threonylcarbamoyladenylate synthase [Treponemataceae bacterium]|nr:L-threonylcarbamoyladenylate synthase [Treponemataceae bacterium]